MSKSPAKTVIVIRESLGVSIAKDTYTFAALILSVGVGVALNSGVLQFIAGLFFCLAIIGRAFRLLNDNTYTIPAARAKLDELEGATPSHNVEGE